MKVPDRIIIALLTTLVFSIPWQTAYLFGAAGNSSHYAVVSITLFDVIFFLLCIAVAMRALTAGVPMIKGGTKGAVICGVLLVLFAALSSLWSYKPLVALLGALRLGEALIVCSLLIAYRKYSLLFLSSLVASATIQSCIALVQFGMQTSSASSWLGMAYHSSQQLGDAVVEVADQRWLRAYGSLPHPNVLAAFLSFALFACASLVGRIQTKRVFFVLLSVWVICIAGLFFTFSREVWLGTALGVGIVVVLRKSYRLQRSSISPALMLMLAAIIIWVSLSVAYQEPLAARIGIGGWQRLEQKSIHERLVSYADGWSLMKSSPMIGVGMHQSALALEKRDAKSSEEKKNSFYQPIHNVPLLVAAELGAVGLLLFFALNVYLLLRLGKKFMVRTPILFGALCMIIVSGSFDHFYWSLQSGMLLWWIVFAFLYGDDTLSNDSFS